MRLLSFFRLLKYYCEKYNKCFEILRPLPAKTSVDGPSERALCYLDVVGKVPYHRFAEMLNLKTKYANILRGDPTKNKVYFI